MAVAAAPLACLPLTISRSSFVGVGTAAVAAARCGSRIHGISLRGGLHCCGLVGLRPPVHLAPLYQPVSDLLGLLTAEELGETLSDLGLVLVVLDQGPHILCDRLNALVLCVVQAELLSDQRLDLGLGRVVSFGHSLLSLKTWGSEVG